MGKTLSEEKVVREFSSGGIVFRKQASETLWLVTQSSPSLLNPKSVWRLPKGRLDDEDHDRPGPKARGEEKATEEEIQQAALKEVREEGGVEAKIISKLETSKYFFTFDGQRILKLVTFYLMEWVNDLPEGFSQETQAVRWLEYKQARKQLSYSGEKKVLDKANKTLNQGI